MMTRVARPVLASVWRNPSPIASTETRTPTTPAIPITITSDVPSRCGMVRRLISVTCTTWLSEVIGSPVPGQRIHDAQPVRAQRGRQADRQRQRRRHAGRPRPGDAAHEQRREAGPGGARERGAGGDRGGPSATGAGGEQQRPVGPHQRGGGGGWG